jgi:hypothetical protein
MKRRGHQGRHVGHFEGIDEEGTKIGGSPRLLRVVSARVADGIQDRGDLLGGEVRREIVSETSQLRRRCGGIAMGEPRRKSGLSL